VTIQIFWDVTIHHWASSSWCLGGL